MVQLSAGMDAGVGVPGYERHRPERTLLYQLVEQYYPAFETQLAAEGKVLPDYVHQEFEEYLKCGRPRRPHLSMVFCACSVTAVTQNS